MDEIEFDQIKATAITTYRCSRGCILGYVSKIPGGQTVFSSQIKGHWRATFMPWEEPLYCECWHVTGILPVSDRPQGKVLFTQDDVRTIEGMN